MEEFDLPDPLIWLAFVAVGHRADPAGDRDPHRPAAQPTGPRQGGRHARCAQRRPGDARRRRRLAGGGVQRARRAVRRSWPAARRLRRGDARPVERRQGDDAQHVHVVRRLHQLAAPDQRHRADRDRRPQQRRGPAGRHASATGSSRATASVDELHDVFATFRLRAPTSGATRPRSSSAPAAAAGRSTTSPGGSSSSTPSACPA